MDPLRRLTGVLSTDAGGAGRLLLVLELGPPCVPAQLSYTGSPAQGQRGCVKPGEPGSHRVPCGSSAAADCAATALLVPARLSVPAEKEVALCNWPHARSQQHQVPDVHVCPDCKLANA